MNMYDKNYDKMNLKFVRNSSNYAKYIYIIGEVGVS